MNVGDLVDDFSLRDELGMERSLYRYLDQGPVVLFFYPLAMSKGCTVESCHFRDLFSDFRKVDAFPIGISADSVDRQHEFSTRHEFGFPLLSDPQGLVARKFGVWRNVPLLHLRRWTFIIGADRRLQRIIRSEVRMNAHADEALKFLRESLEDK